MTLPTAPPPHSQGNDFSDWWWKARLGKCYYQLGLLRDAESQFSSSLKNQEMISTVQVQCPGALLPARGSPATPVHRLDQPPLLLHREVISAVQVWPKLSVHGPAPPCSAHSHILLPLTIYPPSHITCRPALLSRNDRPATTVPR